MKHQLHKLVTPAALIACLAALGVGCWWERPSLGLIVPSTVLLGVYIRWYFTRPRGES